MASSFAPVVQITIRKREEEEEVKREGTESINFGKWTE